MQDIDSLAMKLHVAMDAGPINRYIITHLGFEDRILLNHNFMLVIYNYLLYIY